MASFIGKTIYGTDSEDPNLVNNSFDTIKKVLGVGAIGASAYFGFKKPATEISNGFKNFSDKRRSQLGATGHSIRNTVLESGEVIDQLRAKALDEQAEQIFADGKIEDILNKNSANRKALLQTIVDNISAMEPGSQIEDLESIKQKLYQLMDNEIEFDNATKQEISEYVAALNTNQNSKERFTNIFTRYQNAQVGGLLKGNRTPFQKPNTMGRFAGMQDMFQGMAFISTKDIRRSVRNAESKLKGLGGSILEYVTIDEFGQDAGKNSFKSIYARTSFGGQEHMIPIHLQRNVQGMSYVRTTRELSTRYAAPTGVMRAGNLLSIHRSGMTRAEKVAAFQAEASRDIVADVFEYLGGLKTRGQLLNPTRQLSNFFGERLRAVSNVVSPGVALKHGNFFDQMLRQNIMASTMLQSNKGVITGITDLEEKVQRNLVSELASQYPEVFDATNAGATMRRTLQAPFGERQSFTQITLAQREMTPFNVLSDYAPYNRVIMPTTARESQLIGRAEMFMADPGKSPFMGVNALQANDKFLVKDPVLRAGSGKQLLSVSEKGAGIAGINMAGIMFTRGDAAAKAGLSEGMGYSGRDLRLKRQFTKTIDADAARFKLVEDMLSGSKMMHLKGKKEIDQFYKKYKGMLGSMDSDFVEIPRFSGLEELKIAVSEESAGSGKNKLKFSFESVELTSNNKVFSALLKGDLMSSNLGIRGFKEILAQGLGDRAEATKILTALKRNLGADVSDTLISTFDMGSKAPKYATDIMYGGMRMMGFEEDVLRGAFRQNQLATGVTAREQQKRYLTDFTSSALDLLKDRKGSERTVGYLLGGLQSLEEEGKFGFNKKGQEVDELIRRKLKGSSLDADEVIRFSRQGIVFGASSVFAGSSASILRSNLAKFEPRVANYLSENLRNIHGLKEEEIADYVGGFIARQEGAVEKMRMAPILKMMTSSMSPLANKDVLEKQIINLGEDFKMVGSDELDKLVGSIGMDDNALRTQLKMIGEGKEAIGVDIDQYLGKFNVKNEKVRQRVSKELKSRFGGNKFILPGASTIEDMIGMRIKTAEAGKDIEIENSFIRNLMALKQQIQKAAGAATEEEAAEILNRSTFKAIMKDVNTTTGSLIRNIASGAVLGSGTFQGAGIRLGFQDLGTIRYQDVRRQKGYQTMMTGAFIESKGRAIYLDTQAFMDSMQSYMSAARKSLAAEGVDKDVINKRAKQMYSQRMKSFFYRMTNEKVSTQAVTGMGLRNPMLGPSHIMPGLHMYQSDFMDTTKLFKKLNVRSFADFETIKRFTTEVLDREFREADIFNTLAIMESAEDVEIVKQGKYRKALADRKKRLKHLEKNQISLAGAIDRRNIKYSQKLYDGSFKTPEEKQELLDDIKRLTAIRRDEADELTRLQNLSKDKNVDLLKEEKMTRRGRGEEVTTRFFNEFRRKYGELIGTGGGDVFFPSFDADIKYKIGSGQEVKSIGTRFDITKFAIGDFDGDYYQLFHDAKSNIQELTSKIDVTKQFAYGARFEVMMKQISSGMANVGDRLNVSDLDVEKFVYSEAKKEEILKNVGGLDIQVKTGMLGMALDFNQGDMTKRFNTLSFLSTAQEVLNIKAKKLSMASDIADVFSIQLRESYKTGDTSGLENFIRNTLFRDTDIAKGIEIQGVDFKNVGSQTGTVFEDISKSTSTTKLSVDSIIEGLREAVSSVRSRGLDHLGSNRKIINLMSSTNMNDMRSFQQLVQQSETLETALGTKGGEDQLSELEDIFRRMGAVQSRMGPGEMLRGKTGAALAGIMAGSYLLGNSGSPQVLNPQNTFSDYKVRNSFQVKNAMQDGMDRTMSPAGTTAGMQNNIINRPINTGQYYTQTSNVRLSGNAPSMESAYQMSSAVSRSGGRSLVSINDTRQPITGNYIDRLLGE